MTPRKNTRNGVALSGEQGRLSTDRAMVAGNARRLRVCLVTTEFHGLFKNGGIGTANTGLALGLAFAGHEVTVAFADADDKGPRVREGNFSELQDRYRSLGLALDYVPASPDIPNAFDDCRSASYCVYLYLKSRSFDVVYFNDCGGHGYYALLAKHVGTFRGAPRMYVVAHGPHEWVLELNSLRYWNRAPVITSYLEKRCAQLADALISPSQHLVDWMISHEWIMPREVRVFQNIVRLPDSMSAAMRSSKSKDISELVFFGRLEVRKGVELFCDAIDLLVRLSDVSGIRITFMGKFSIVAGLHSGMYVVERARSWPSSLRILSTFDQEEALTYLNRPGVVAIIPSFAENSPCVVAECLQLGVPFIATSGGGTVELVAPGDREFCLIPTDAEALAARLTHILRSGHQSAQMAVAQEISFAQWLRLTESGTDSDHHETPIDSLRSEASPSGKAAQPLVSVCIGSSITSSNQKVFMDSLLEQTYPHLEIASFDEPSWNGRGQAPRGKLRSEEAGSAVSLGPETSGDNGLRHNATLKKAAGDYLLFADGNSITLMPECIDTLIAAALRTGADIITAMPVQDREGSNTQSSGRSGYFPVGACPELGAFENCFGDGLVLVKRLAFEQTAGFPDRRESDIDIWLFLAKSVLAGLLLEVVPEPLFRYVKRRHGAVYRSTFVGNQRRILDAFAGEKIERVRHILESITDTQQVDNERLHEALQSVSSEARGIALRVSSSYEPNSEEALRGFLQFCIERRKVEEAIDYALHNKRSLLSDAIESVRAVAETLAVDAVRSHTLDLWHTVALTNEVRQRLRPVAGIRTLKFVPASEGVASHPIQTGLAVFKAAAACPPLARFVRTMVRVDALMQPSIFLAVVATVPDARLRLSAEGLESEQEFWWSEWIPANDGGRETELTVRVSEPVDQLLDLHFLCKIEEDISDMEGQIVWESVDASVTIEGVMTESAIEIDGQTTAIPREVIDEGILLSETPDFPFPVFVPGDQTLLHPLPGRASLVRIPGAVPPGTKAVRSVVSIELAEAHPTQFATWIRRSSDPAAAVSEFTPADAFSGWFLVSDKFRRHSFTVRLDTPADEVMDIYLATRVVEYPDVHYCHAVWHELLLLE
jgi:glycosyltransferase involved in cell wall biosynthesis